MKNPILWTLVLVFGIVKGQFPSLFFPPSFVTHEFPRRADVPGVDSSCPTFRCVSIPEGCVQPQIIVINGQRCPFCPRNRCSDPSNQEQRDGNEIVSSTSELSRTRSIGDASSSNTISNDAKVNERQTTEQQTRSSSSRSHTNGRSSSSSRSVSSASSRSTVVLNSFQRNQNVIASSNPESPFYIPDINKRRTVHGGNRGIRGRRVNLSSSRRQSEPSPARSPARPRPSQRPRPSERPRGKSTNQQQQTSKVTQNAPNTIPQVENQPNAHDLFPGMLPDSMTKSNVKQNKRTQSTSTSNNKEPVKHVPEKPKTTPAPSHRNRPERQATPAIHLIFHSANENRSPQENEHPNQNQPNAPLPNRVLPSGNNALPNRGSGMPIFPSFFHNLAGSPFTRVVQQGSQNNNRPNGNTQPRNQQLQTINGINPFMPAFFLNRARTNNANGALPSSNAAAPSVPTGNAAQNSNLRNFQFLPPFFRGILPFNPTVNQNAVPGMANNVQANQVQPANAEPSAPPVSPEVQAEINQWMDQMTMPIQEILGNGPSPNQATPQANQNQGTNQMALPTQLRPNGGQTPNSPALQNPALNQAHVQQWLRQMALQRLAQGQIVNQATPQGMFLNPTSLQTQNVNRIPNPGSRQINAAGLNTVNPPLTPQNNGAGGNSDMTQWLNSVSQDIHRQLTLGANPAGAQPNGSPQPGMNGLPQVINNTPPQNGAGNQATGNNWLDQMALPIHQELTRTTGNAQPTPSSGGNDLAGSSWFNQMLNPIEHNLRGV